MPRKKPSVKSRKKRCRMQTVREPIGVEQWVVATLERASRTELEAMIWSVYQSFRKYVHK